MEGVVAFALRPSEQVVAYATAREAINLRAELVQ
jgi:hypothetical protein